ncbi:MAG: response regulator [Bacteroidetes bacterium]|nr:response regulator [Bacteroidota bacterium]
MKIKMPKFKYKRVMLLDDNELDNYINEKIIQASHFSEKIYKNTSGKSALEFLSNIRIPENGMTDLYPEIIFVDLNMPMMDGFQFINYLKNTEKAPLKSRFVILTSSINDEDRRKAEELDKEIVFLNKPLNEMMLSQL